MSNIISEPKSSRSDLLGLGILATAALLREEDSVDVGENPALGDGDAGQQLVELLVIADGELNIDNKYGKKALNIPYLKVAGDDPGLLVVPGGVAGELEDLGGEILHDGGQVDRGSSSDPLGVVTLAEKPGRNNRNYWL